MSNNFITQSINTKPAFIYQLVCKNSNIKDTYIGSTLDLKRRLYHHKYLCKNSNQKLYKTINENGGFTNWRCVVLSIITKWNTKNDYKFIEKTYIQNIKPSCNKNIPTRTISQYQKDNKDKLRIYNKNYVKNNKDKIDKINLKWREKNREKISEKTMIWYNKNKYKIKIRNNRKTNCICGCISNFHNIKYGHHRHSKKHHNNLLNTIKQAKQNLKYNPLNINVFQ